MKMNDEKILMSEVAVLYYEKKHTQQEIADIMNLSRQTVSKLLNDAIKENIVEIKINNPVINREHLREKISQKFSIKTCIVCNVSGHSSSVRMQMTVRAAKEYLNPILKSGGKKIAVSWGRTVEELINVMPEISTEGNTVFPLFGATDNENSYFSSNELARSLADKLGASVQYAWFPYLPDNEDDCALLKRLSYFEKLQALWREADLAIVGIGNTDVLETFGKTFGYSDKKSEVIGDIATHFFNAEGEFIPLYDRALCASAEDIKKAKETVAIAFGAEKVKAIIGALKTGLIDTLITDEYTAKGILEA